IKNGCFGLIATNTIAQGDTRSTGLRYICENGGTIFNAQKRLKWPGLAAVVVSVVNVFKGDYQGIKLLDGRKVDLISAFLFKSGGNNNPAVLLANADKSFQGSIVLGMGFTFDDSKPDATPIPEMQRLIEQNPKNQERIFPYIGGEEVNSSPNHTHHRYVINFGEMSEGEAREYPDLMKIVEEKVKPQRISLPPKNSWNKTVAAKWWLFGADRVELRNAIAPLERVLVCCIIGKHLSFAFLPNGMVYSHKLNIFSLDSYAAFAILQGRIHEVFARFFSSTMKDDLNYSPSDCFQTFPFPKNWETNPTLEAIGKEYYEYRAALMIRNNQGLTDTYNRFHNPDEYDPEIIKLRELHTAMDKAVLDAYGWSDIATDCNFLLDYEEEEDDNLTPNPSPYQREGGRRQKKKPWRYRWSEETHDEVLARLLDLNQQRHQEEILGGKVAGKSKGKGKKTTKKRKSTKSKNDKATIPGIDNI
ncbi:MAG: type IIL restriction-modification enzyme MmeI, partial [Cyanobacteria bacterium P01_H01_bin.150]